MMKPTSIIGKYLIKQAITNFFFVLFVISCIIMMFDLIEILRKTSGKHDVSIWFLAQYVLAKLPETLDKIIPFIVMISTMITFWKISKTNEFVIIRASGVSIWGVLTPVLLAAFLIGAVYVGLFNPVSARLFELKETMKYRLETNNQEAFLFSNKGLWIRERQNENKVAIINANGLNLRNNTLWLNDLTILEVDENMAVIQRIEAFVATLEDGYLNLKDVHIYQSGKTANILNSLNYKTEIDIQRIKDNFVEPEAISFWNLQDIITFYNNSGFSVLRYTIRFLSLLAIPFLLMAMVLVAGIFALKPSLRHGGVLFMIVSGLVVGFSVYFLSQVILAFGLNYYIPAWFAVWAPVIIVSSISVSIYLHKEE